MGTNERKADIKGRTWYVALTKRLEIERIAADPNRALAHWIELDFPKAYP
jgi:hypothetical protein